MEIVKTFGRMVDDLSVRYPGRARMLLRFGWEMQQIKNRLVPDSRIFEGQRGASRMMMEAMLQPLRHPDRSAIVSVFTPCELLQEAGLFPYNVESFSSYLSGTRAEQPFLQNAEESGLAETLCSYHKTFIGAAQTGLLPKPRCIIYTNLACDANLVTFRRLAELYKVPLFAIDVPLQQNEANVGYVADQLRNMGKFLEEQTGRRIDEDRLNERVRRGRRSLENYHEFQLERADRYIPSDLVTPMYEGIAACFLLGTKQEEQYTSDLLDAVKKAPPSRGKRIFWMHTIPFWSDAVKEQLEFSENAQIVGSEFAQFTDLAEDSDDPYESMACRMVYHVMNGSVSRRIKAGICHAKETNADGAVWFAHWGCKHTLGGAQLAKSEFEKAGIPLLILNGDGCDRSHGGEGQTATRLGAFLEMLGGR